MKPLVTILTYCAHPALAYGTTLVFKTLRTGFPTADIEIYDNGSHPDVRDQIMAAAQEVGASFEAISPRHYSDHYRWLLLKRELRGRPLVLLDPDVIFWQNVEGWQFGDSLMAGRLIPEMGGGLVVVHPRLHPSLLWVPDVDRLRGELAKRWPSERAGKWNLMGPASERTGSGLRMFDTLAPLYEAVRDRCFAFDEAQLDAYDHLFNGSHLPSQDSGEPTGFEAIRNGHHAAATGDYARLRGLWRAQEAYFRSERTSHGTSAQRAANVLPATKRVQDWQGLGFSDEELSSAMAALKFRMVFMPQAVQGGPRPVEAPKTSGLIC